MLGVKTLLFQQPYWCSDCRIAALPVAAISGYRAHLFEKNFWNYIKKTLSEIGEANAEMSEPVTVTQ